MDTPRAGDEDVFVLTTEGAASLREGPLSLALTELLHRKVWIATAPPYPLDRLELVGVVPEV